MASCGDGNEPDPKTAGFQFKVEALSTKVQYTVMPGNTKADYYKWVVSKSYADQKGGIEEFLKDFIKTYKYDYWRENEYIANGKSVKRTAIEPEMEYYVFACYVEKGEDEKATIISDIAYQKFESMEKWTSNGVFSVSNEKYVHFATSISCLGDGVMVYYEDPWSIYKESLCNWNWEFVENFNTYENNQGFFVLSNKEWWYLFRERERAEELFAHATITIDDQDIHGLILLPDNWEMPDNIKLTTSYDMEIRWEESQQKYINSDFNGYEQNKLNKIQWEALEFAGAVFLPATYSLNAGWYWSSDEDASGTSAYQFSFYYDNISLAYLQYAQSKSDCIAILPVRELK